MDEEQKDPLAEMVKKAIKTKVKAIAASIAITVLPVFFGIVVVIIFAAMIILPLAGLFGRDIDLVGGTSGGMSKEEQAFSDKLDEKIVYWEEKKVLIDSSLVLSIVLYQAPFEFAEDCDFEKGDCYDDIRNYKKLVKEIDPVVDNMVEETKVFSCKSEVIKKTTDCPKDENGEYEGDLSKCTTTLETTYKEAVLCGKEAGLCDNICEGDYILEEKATYQLKNEADYKKWLNAEFLPDKLKSLDIEIPTDPVLKEDFFEEIHDEIMYYRASANEDSSYVQFFGSNIRSFGTAGAMDPEILDKLVSPLGEQKCSQTACFGVYGINNSNKHSGVDIGNNGTKPELFSIYSGEIITLVVGSKNCEPNFDTTPICPRGCTASKVLIKHEIMIGGITRYLYSSYVHLDSIAPGLTVGSKVYTGQFIGVMGNTGCSSATHLHFEMWDEQKKRHNPEELLKKVECRLIPTCEVARERYL